MKKKYIISGFILLIAIGIFIFCRTQKENVVVSDAEKFKQEYSLVTINNVFVYRDSKEIIRIMENGTGVVYLGFPECPWCQSYVKYLDEVAKEVGIEKIYYYNIYEDRKNNTDDYKKIVSLLGDNLQYDDEGSLRVYVPNVSFHINGEVIGNDCETSLDTLGLDDPNQYWNEERVLALKLKLTTYMKQIKDEINVCTDCNK